METLIKKNPLSSFLLASCERGISDNLLLFVYLIVILSVSGLIISQNTRKAAMRAAKASVKNKKVHGE